MRRLITWTLAAAAMAFTPVALSSGTSVERIVVPYAAGGITDLYGRIIANQLSDIQKNSVIVDNRPGGGGAIGTAAVAKSDPDGRTILLGSVGTATNPAMIKTLPYSPSDIEPVAQVASSPLILYVRNGLPTNLKDLLAHAAKTPGGLTFANSGVGSSPNLAAALFARKAGIEVTHVNYRGTSAAINDLLSGQVDAYFDTPQAMAHVASGRIHPIAVAAPERISLVPDLPTLKELGIPDVYASSWWGIFVPAKTPGETVEALQTELRKVVENPDVQQRARDMGAIALFRNQTEFRKFFDEEVKRWGEIIAAEKLSAQ